MNQSHNTSKKPGIFAKIKSVAERLFSRKVYPPSMPYNPQPGQGSANRQFGGSSSFYSESQTDIKPLDGTSLKFGTQVTVEVDQAGRSNAVTCNPSYISGSGRRISKIEEVGGICLFCKELADKAFNEGKLTAEQAQLQSLFDVNSAKQCDICGINTCSIHTRPTQTPQGPVNICIACRNVINRQERRKRIIGVLLSPFIDDSGDK